VTINARMIRPVDVSDDEDPRGYEVMTRQPTLFLTVGLPCTGKTTAARRIEVDQKAIRLTKDEWVKALYGHANPRSANDVIEGRLILIGLRALELGSNVVIDYGLWSRSRALRSAAGSSRPRCDGGAVLLRTHPRRAAATARPASDRSTTHDVAASLADRNATRRSQRQIGVPRSVIHARNFPRPSSSAGSLSRAAREWVMPRPSAEVDRIRSSSVLRVDDTRVFNP
jgi:predicted kinase